MKKTALFPGSFDPFTLGHQAIVEDGLKIFDRIVVGIGSNSEKNGLLTVENRKRLIEDLYGDDDRVMIDRNESDAFRWVSLDELAAIPDFRDLAPRIETLLGEADAK